MKTKIKIARVVTVPFVFTHILDLLETLSRDPHFELHIICSDGPYLAELKRRNPTAIFHTVIIAREINLVSDLKSLFNLTKLYRKEKFTIVHSHSPKAGLVSAMAGFLAGIKIRLHTFTGQVWVNLKGPKKWLLKGLDKLISSLNTHNYTDSFGQLDFLIANGIGSKETLSVIHKGSFGGVSVERFNSDKLTSRLKAAREELFPRYSGKILLYLGRINEDKGIKELAEAFYLLKQKYEVKLLLVGPLESLNRPQFLKIIENLKEDKDVVFVNFTNEPEIYMGIADIFCFPSYREGFGTVALEASSMGKPVVASNIYGLSEAVVDKETGLLFEMKNTQDLVSKVSWLLSDETYAKKLGLNGRNRVEEFFSDKILTQKMIDAYIELDKK